MIYVLRFRVEVDTVQKATALRDKYAAELEDDDTVEVIASDMAQDDPE